MVEQEKKIAQEVKKRIAAGEKSKIYFVNNFSDLQNDQTVTKALQRLSAEGFLIRLSQGIYLYPEPTRFGALLPSLDDIVKAIAERDNALILPTGSTALNKLGFSSQVPMNAVYMTTGSTRTIKVGNRKLSLKHSAPRNFVYKGTLMPLVVESLKVLGENNIDNEVKVKLGKIISSISETDLNTFVEDLQYTPQWIRTIIQKITKKNQL
ncbi:MAG: DUF6088 family protein [Omnitrophica WOR_2 bacterium]|jgi:hypothetical protein